MTETSDHRCYERLFIGGHWREPSTPNRITVISPHTEEVVGRVPDGQPPTWTGRWRPPVRRSTTARGPG